MCVQEIAAPLSCSVTLCLNSYQRTPPDLAIQVRTSANARTDKSLLIDRACIVARREPPRAGVDGRLHQVYLDLPLLVTLKLERRDDGVNAVLLEHSGELAARVKVDDLGLQDGLRGACGDERPELVDELAVLLCMSLDMSCCKSTV
jgi:hypothetical protein